MSAKSFVSFKLCSNEVNQLAGQSVWAKVFSAWRAWNELFVLTNDGNWDLMKTIFIRKSWLNFFESSDIEFHRLCMSNELKFQTRSPSFYPENWLGSIQIVFSLKILLNFFIMKLSFLIKNKNKFFQFLYVFQYLRSCRSLLRVGE